MHRIMDFSFHIILFIAEPETNRRRNGRGGGVTKSQRGRGAGGRGGRRQSPAPVAQQSGPAEPQQNATSNHFHSSENSPASTNGKSEITSNGEVGNTIASTNGSASHKSDDWSSNNSSDQVSQNHLLTKIMSLLLRSIQLAKLKMVHLACI